MEFSLSISVDRPVAEVFAFLEDMRNHPQEERSQVILVERLTPEPVDVGTQFREIVQTLPFLRVEMISEVTQHDRNERVEIAWHGGGMKGVLTYRFESENGVTGLSLHETVTVMGLMRLAEPVIRRTFERMLVNRLHGIKRVLESRNEGPTDLEPNVQSQNHPW
jgi:carbon monoxide dehydrogenase subunit G